MVYFNEFFNISKEEMDEYGAFNISLVSDLPLFIDPFLLFNSKKDKYQELHANIIKYMIFLRDKSLEKYMDSGLLKAWYEFPEIKQNWLGFCQKGNKGSGLGNNFAQALYNNFNSSFSDFGNENITQSSHIEKLCLINSGVGRDNISDFTTNLILEFLLEYTERFAQTYIQKNLRKVIEVKKVRFNYITETWMNGTYDLPYINGDYVILTPKDILTKDEAWINRTDMLYGFENIINSMDNNELISQMNNYFIKMLPKEKKIKKTDKEKAIQETIDKFPDFIDYFIKYKEDRGVQAEKVSNDKVVYTERNYIDKANMIISLLKNNQFYDLKKDTYFETLQRVKFMKHIIENNDGYKLFYQDGKAISKESDLQLLFRLTWFASDLDVNREVNNGRGPVDYKISFGANESTLVEFKLAKNSKLKKNLENQVEIYEKANNTKKSIKVIMYYTEEEYKRVNKILKDLKLDNKENIVIIDARIDNKLSASNV